MRRYDAILFDLDGVICHTDRYHYLAWKQIADQLGIPFDETANRRLKGVGRMRSLEILLEVYPGTLTESQKFALADQKNELYRGYLKQMTPGDLSLEVRDTLKQLRTRGYKLAIGSSSKNTLYILERLGLENYFDAVADGNMITRSKPDPEVFVKAAKLLHTSPARCLVVEDAEAGVQAARSGGMDCAALGLQSKGARYELEHFSDLLHIL